MDVLMPVTKDRVEDVVRLFSQAWWTKNRSAEDVADILNESDLTAGIVEGDRLVAFVRALTDWRFKAVVMDLIIDDSYRNKGLGRRLCEVLLKDPRVAAIEDVELYCHSDLVGYYAAMGFFQPPETQFMRRSNSTS